MSIFAAPLPVLPDVGDLRDRVRALVANTVPGNPAAHRANCWAVADEGFSRAAGAAGLIGMIWPERYGGHARAPLERYVVLEELLAAGAPVAAHWIADRQTGPLLLRHGTEEQKLKLLPAMARGELYACIGMSEPGAGSDLASVRTRAERTKDGWRVNGQKLWTSGAHRAHIMIALVRTDPASTRNAGLSQLLVTMDTPGITVRPVIDLTGAHDFNEVFFDDVLLPHDALIGAEGEGWKQVTAELSLERSGPERYLSSFALFVELMRWAGPEPDAAVAALIGRTAAELWTLRRMSWAVAAKLAGGEDPALEAAMVKDLGNSFEQALPPAVQALAEIDPAGAPELAAVLAQLLMVSPSFSLRGGTREILRGIIARGLGLR